MEFRSVSTIFWENKRTDAGLDSRIQVARPNSHTRTGTGTDIFSSSADHEIAGLAVQP